tara:strand:- start:302 stop:4933 length:4632 start_codon:yes stop_codon:yes gene_type:complete
MTNSNDKSLMPFGAWWEPNTPERRTNRQLSELRLLTPRKNVGFVDKVGLAFSTGTVTVPFLTKEESFFSPTGVSGFSVSEKDLEDFAGDLPEHIQNRILASSSSFPSFLEEVYEARKRVKMRQELYSGGMSGTLTGLGLEMAATASEAVMLTILGGGLFGAGARMSQAAGKLITTGQRIRGATKAAAIAAAVDVPLEFARYEQDNTLRPADLLIAIGASGTLSAGIGAWKPGLFLNELQGISRTAAAKEAADAARAAGKPDVAEAVEETIKQRVSVRPYQAFVDEAEAMNRPQLIAKAKELGIKTSRRNAAGGQSPKKSVDLRREIVAAQREFEGADTVNIGRQVARDLEGLNKTEKADYARNLGVSETVIRKGGIELRRAIHRQAQEAAKTGKITTGVIPKLPEGVRLSKTASFKKIKVRFKSNVEAALWTIAKGKNAEKAAKLKQWFKDGGVDDVDELAKQFVKQVEEDSKSFITGKGVWRTKTYGLEVERFKVGKESFLKDEDAAVSVFYNSDRSKAWSINYAIDDENGRMKVDFSGYELNSRGKIIDVILMQGRGSFNRESLQALRTIINDAFEVAKSQGITRVRFSASTASRAKAYKRIAKRYFNIDDSNIDETSSKSMVIDVPYGPLGDLRPDIRAMGLSAKTKGGEPIEPEMGIFQSRDPYDFTVDEDLVEASIPKAPGDPGIHPVSDIPDAPIVVNGEVRGEGPADMVRLREEDLAARDAEQYKVFKHGQGIRETIARAIEVFPGDVPFLRPIFSFFAPVSIRLLRSESQTIRRFADLFLENPRGGGQNVTTATSINTHRMTSRLWQGLDLAKANARKAGTRLEDIDIIRGVRSGQDFDGPLGEAVRAVRKFNSEILKYGKEGGVFTEAIPESAKYFHRSYSSTAFAKAIQQFGEDEVLEFFTQAIMSHKSTRAAKLTHTKAQSVARRIMEYAKDPEGARDWRGSQIMIDGMRQRLIKEGIAEDEVDDFIRAIAPHVENQPHISYGRRRIELDETFEGTLGGQNVHIDEFFNNDLRGNVTRYAQRVIGGVETRKGFQALFGEADLTMADVLSRLRMAAGDAGEDSQFIQDIASHAYKGLTGLPIYSNPQFMKWSMASNSFAQATIGMTLGFAQLPEIASIMMRSGFRASLQQLPSLREIGTIFTMGIRDLATGRQGLGMASLRDDLASVLETFTGVGGDYRRGEHFMRRLDDMAFDDEYVKLGMNKYMDYGRQTAVLNPLGIMPMDTFLRRWAVRSSFQHFVNEAYTMKAGKAVLNDGFWSNAKVRFEQIGVTGEAFDRISAALRDPSIVSTHPGMFGRYTVKNIDVSKMADVAAFDEFALALKRHTDSMVQRQSFGESPYWVNTQVGKLISQYRVFMLASKSKQMAAGIARGDMREAANVVGSAGLGILAYQLQTYYRSLGMSERDRQLYLSEKFKDENLIKAGVVKGSYSNIFPMLIDSGSFILGKGPVFDPSMRTTGLGIDPIRGSVPYSVLYGKMWPAAREITGELFREDELSESDLRNVQSLIWATKIPGVDQLINSQFIDKLGLPEKDN